ncbi:MAG TPA: phenylalanine--tRNA ligase subunit beta [Longimicrobiales bacterium]|nr:phenylalanine--tRNA ligase subunit beta [Longimicrobiales bacterium]
MNVSHAWLRALAPSLEASAPELADRLAMLGATVDEVVPLGVGLENIVSARVVSVRPHPNADRLTVCEVDAGAGTMQVVCGAPNVEAGRTYAFAPVGAVLPGGMVIREARIRGETSEGMLCSERELGLGRDQSGIMLLPGDPAPGLSLVEIAGLDDTRLVVDVTPNRPDLLSHVGIAAELAAKGRAALSLPPIVGAPAELELELEPVASRSRAETAGVSVSIEDDGCRRYLAAVVRGVTIGPSPAWLTARIRSVGLRPINNVVDATNYVLYELGQPLHAFDLDLLRGPAIVVRGARAGERLTTLDGANRALEAGTLVIADAERAVAVAGVMGGAESEVTPATRNLLIECALFEPTHVRASRRALALPTDASHRFERGVDPDGLERALRRVVALILATAGGAAERTYADVTRIERAPRSIELRAERVRQVLGIDIEPARIADLLSPIGFVVEVGSRGTIHVDVPGARLYDVEREIDLVEEVARRYGYDRFPEESRAYRAGTVPDDAMARLEDRLRERLVARGFLESRTMPFVPAPDGDVALLLPLSAEESRLRRALLPSLMRRVEHNWARGVDDLRLFEIGTGFGPPPARATGGADVSGGSDAADSSGARPSETRRLAFIMTGGRRPGHWSGVAEAFDVWDLKGALEELAPALGGAGTSVRPGDADTATDNRSLRYLGPEMLEVVDAEGRVIGHAGRIRDDAIDVPARVVVPTWAAEIVLAVRPARDLAYAPLPTHPAVERDLALLVPAAVPAGVVERSIRGAAGELLDAVAPFDVFRGAGLPAGSRSVAFRLRFRAPGRTLTDEEVDRAVERVLRALKEEHDIERR